MWLRLLAGQLGQQKLRTLVTDALRGELSQQANPRPVGPCDVLFIFALNAESGGLVDLLAESHYAKRPSFIEWSGQLGGRPVVVAEVGVGSQAASQGTTDALAMHQPGWVISAGFAGGLTEDFKKGHLLLADEIVDQTGRSLQIDARVDPSTLSRAVHTGRLLTVDRILREPDERRSLAQQHAAVACDMESFAVAEVCRQAGVRLLSVRVISDTVDDRLPPEIEKLLSQTTLVGKLGTAAGAIMNRFSAVGDLWQLYEDALKCSQRLAKFLESMLPQLQVPPPQ